MAEQGIQAQLTRWLAPREDDDLAPRPTPKIPYPTSLLVTGLLWIQIKKA